MTLRAGSYDHNYQYPDYRGIVRNDGSPWYVCTHKDQHSTTRAARQCAQDALAAGLRDRDPRDPRAPLPDGWTVYRRENDPAIRGR